MLQVILALIPSILSFIESLIILATDRRLIEAGRAEAIAAAGQSLVAAVTKAQSVKDEAQAIHQADNTDGAFDRDFERKP